MTLARFATRTLLVVAFAVWALVLTATPCVAQFENLFVPLFPDDPQEDARFGSGVALQGDEAFVGAPGFDGGGAVYRFTRRGAAWSQSARLEASDGLEGDAFGSTVRVSGEWLLIGAPGRDLGDEEDAGAVYVFRRVGDDWIEFDQWLAANGDRRDDFGAAIALDAGRAAVTVFSPPEPRVEPYRFDGTAWVRETILFSSEPGSTDFGATVAMHSGHLVIGDPQLAAGERLRVYGLSKTGEWTFEQALGGEPQRSVGLGSSGLAIWDDRLVAAAGASPQESDLVYGYEYDGTTWAPTSLVERPFDIAFGRALALAEDMMLAGATNFPGNRPFGEAEWLVPTGDTWSSDSVYYERPDRNEELLLGDAVAIDLPYSIVGAPLGRGPGDEPRAGRAFVFYSLPCRTGGVGVMSGEVSNVLFVNGSLGDLNRYVRIESGETVTMGILSAPGGGSRFVVHANEGFPTTDTITPLPAGVGTACFPFLRTNGAMPLAVWNNIGRTGKLGESRDFSGAPISDPGLAPTIFLSLFEGDPVNLPPGTTITFQGLLLDAESESPRGVSTTNAFTIRFF